MKAKDNEHEKDNDDEVKVILFHKYILYISGVVGLHL